MSTADRVRAAELLAAIQGIRAVDHHAHACAPRRPEPAEAERPDPLGRTPFPYPIRLRPTNPEYAEAWRALYGYAHVDMTVAFAREALRSKHRLMQQMGTQYPSWVLDQAGIEVMLVCMASLGPGLDGPRFVWVPYADGLLHPFAGSQGTVQAPGEEPGPLRTGATLEEYIEAAVRAQLKRWKGAGAVAVKFGIAYRRPLDVTSVPAARARAIYAEGQRGEEPGAADNRALEDYLFRATAQEAGTLGLAVHIHTGTGSEPYFHIGGSDPLLLEPFLNDEAFRGTRFVLLHGGWPFARQAGVMLQKPNVYLDFSAQTFLRSTRALSQVLEEWLAWYPEKVLFGSDAYSEDTPLANWEEKVWLATRTAREALSLALTRMIEDGQVTRARAEELARLVLRENALRLYGLEVH